jgi:hypothetical protein
VNRAAPLPGPSPDARRFLWANVVALACGVLTGAALFVPAWVSSNIAGVVQQNADQRILEARTRGDEARADAAKANQRASEAAERAPPNFVLI